MHILSRSINKHGRHRQFLFLIGWFLKIFSSETTWPNEPKLVGSIYGRSSISIAHFIPIHWQTWLPQAMLVSYWLISKKTSPLKPLSQMNRNLVGSNVRSSIRIAYFLPIRWHHRQFLFLIGWFLKNLLLWNCLAKWTETW